MKKKEILGITSLVTISLSIIFSLQIKSLFFQKSGQIYRMMFLHVPLAWISFFAFFIVMLSSIQYLRNKKIKYDLYAIASAEIGVIFSTLTLLTGSIWARAEWQTWWRWDPRLTTTLITWIIYMAYLALRTSIETEKKPRISAVYGIIAFISVPITYLSIKISLHPQPITSGGISPNIAIGLGIGVIAYTAFFSYLLSIRANQLKTEKNLKSLKKKGINKFKK